MLKTQARKAVHAVRAGVAEAGKPLKMAAGRLRQHLPLPLEFKGAWPSLEAALSSQPPQAMVGYDHDEVAEVSFERMCDITVWDYPVMLWLERLMPGATAIIDAGGHMGTKYRAFGKVLDLSKAPQWVVYDLPAIVRAGEARARRDGLPIRFEHEIDRLPPAEILLASGLLQYYPNELSHLIGQLPARPRHLVLNKVAVREGPTVVTMSRIGPSWVPYQIRERGRFIRDVEAAGYRLVDEWDIPSLSHVIPTHPELGASQSKGFVFEAAS
jgi:putative methyltransferase (TIGR04325 family)